MDLENFQNNYKIQIQTYEFWSKDSQWFSKCPGCAGGRGGIFYRKVWPKIAGFYKEKNLPIGTELEVTVLANYKYIYTVKKINDNNDFTIKENNRSNTYTINDWYKGGSTDYWHKSTLTVLSEPTTTTTTTTLAPTTTTLAPTTTTTGTPLTPVMPLTQTTTTGVPLTTVMPMNPTATDGMMQPTLEPVPTTTTSTLIPSALSPIDSTASDQLMPTTTVYSPTTTMMPTTTTTTKNPQMPMDIRVNCGPCRNNTNVIYKNDKSKTVKSKEKVVDIVRKEYDRIKNVEKDSGKYEPYVQPAKPVNRGPINVNVSYDNYYGEGDIDSEDIDMNIIKNYN